MAMDILYIIGGILFIILGIVGIYYVFFRFDKTKLKKMDFTPHSSQDSFLFFLFLLVFGIVLSILFETLPSWFAKIVLILLSLIPILIGVMVILQTTGLL